MSFGNFQRNDPVSGERALSQGQYKIREEPNELDDAARLADAITYMGNATYPLSPPTSQSLTTDFVPLYSGLNIDDHLRIAPELTTLEDRQFSNITYRLKYSGNTDEIQLRGALYDASLNPIHQYETLTVDSSGKSFDGLDLRGFSVIVPENEVENAKYFFVQAKRGSVGTAELTFDYGNSVLEKSSDMSVDPSATPSRPSTNIFSVQTTEVNYDLSGTGGVIGGLQSDIAQLQTDLADSDVSIGLLDTGKVSKSGDTMSGTLAMTSGTNYPSGWESNIRLPGVAALIENFGNPTPVPSYEPAIGLYGNQPGGQRGIYMWTGSKSGNQRLGDPPPTWGDYSVFFEESAFYNMNIDLEGHKIVGSAEPTDPSDTTTKSYVDTLIGDLSGDLRPAVSTNTSDIATKVGKAGDTMTGQLNMGGNKITNVAVPTIATDVASKSYVDTTVAGGGANLIQTVIVDVPDVTAFNVEITIPTLTSQIVRYVINDITANSAASPLQLSVKVHTPDATDPNYASFVDRKVFFYVRSVRNNGLDMTFASYSDNGLSSPVSSLFSVGGPSFDINRYPTLTLSRTALSPAASGAFNIEAEFIPGLYEDTSVAHTGLIVHSRSEAAITPGAATGVAELSV